MVLVAARPAGRRGRAVQVRVDDGWSVSRIGDELVDRDVIGSSLVWNVYTRLKDRKDFQAGTYALRKDMGVRNAVAALEGGPEIDYTELAVPPGLWTQEIAQRVGDSCRAGPRTRSSPRSQSGAKRSKYQPDGRQRRSKACCGRTRTASPTPTTRSTCSVRW